MPPNITQQIRELTGITAHALARKLGMPVATIESWEAGASSPEADALAALEELLVRTQATEPARAPRLLRPQLESAVVCADSLEYLRQLPDESVSMILSDIPYGIGLDQWDVLHANTNSAYLGASAAQQRAGSGFKKRRKPINGWSSADEKIPLEYQQWCTRWAAQWLRVLRPGGSAVVFAGRRLAHRCVSALEDAGFNMRDMLAWLRPAAAFRAQRLSVVYRKRGDLANARHWEGWRVGNLRPTFEPIIWCFKPYAQTIADNMLDHQLGAFHLDRYAELTGGANNVLEVGFAAGERGLHEAQKPVELLRTLIELCSVPGQLVLDPFAGSGSTAVAAKRCGRGYLAVELDPAMCDVARKRLDE